MLQVWSVAARQNYTDLQHFDRTSHEFRSSQLIPNMSKVSQLCLSIHRVAASSHFAKRCETTAGNSLLFAPSIRCLIIYVKIFI